MVIDSIREFNRAVPFMPYEIHMASGNRYSVRHPDFVFISPRGSFVVVVDAKDRPHHLNGLLIERASLVNGRKSRRWILVNYLAPVSLEVQAQNRETLCFIGSMKKLDWLRRCRKTVCLPDRQAPSVALVPSVPRKSYKISRHY